MIFQKLRKVLKRDRIGAGDLYLNLQKKYYLYNYFSAIRSHPLKTRREHNLLSKCVLEMRARALVEKKECGDFYSRKLAYKVLYVMKRNKREKVEKRIYNKVANKYLTFRLKFKSLKGLGLRVDRNQMLRKDLVKRYWIHNSDDEQEEYDEAAVP
jgi:hypothetical protein